MPELLLEILSEEIPARMQRRAAEDLKRLVTEGLKGARLEFGKAEAFATPRRLALVIDGLPDQQPDLREERKGPKVGAPDKAIEGFLRSVGLDSLDQCEKRDAGKGGEAWFAVIEREGKATAEVLPLMIWEAVTALSWPKSMRWGLNRFPWVRPIHRVLAMYDGQPLKGYLRLGRGGNAPTVAGFSSGGAPTEEDADFGEESWLKYSNETVGHRFLSPDAFEVSDFADYKAKLLDSKVVLDAADRRDIIAAALKDRAAAESLTVNDDPGLLDEVAGLVEWPVPLIGTIDDAFMGLPEEALTSSMRAHQKYFALLNPDGSLAPRFGFVANMAAADGRAAIVAGNERVLRARLADAKFFWDQDRRMRLADRAPALDAITFHAKLGTVAEKAQRVAALAADLTANIPGADRDCARSAALLCKADLVTGMVGEFPDLQGVMGRYYALHDGEKPAVADAIAEHYSPLGPNDRCPTAPVSVAVALADKIDTLVGFWLIDEKPTGSKDPYALRRAALGVIRLILENALRLNLLTAFAVAMRLYQDENIGLRDRSHAADDARDAAVDLLGFFADRLKVHLRDSGVRHDLIAAVFGLGGEDDLVRLMARVEALGRFLGSDDGENLLVAYRRAANIVRIESRKDKTDYDGDVRPDLLRQDEEKTLFTNFAEAISGAEEAIALEDFDGAMLAMAALRRPVDAFFDKVTVNADDPALRENRLRLLSRFGTTLDRIADFSQIEG